MKINPDEYVDGNEFHQNGHRVYKDSLDWAVNKSHKHMAKVVYTATHFNPNYNDDRRGKGKNFATWIFSEEPDTREGLFSSGLELMMDATMEPLAEVGLHVHHHTEEIYYIISGSITMTTVDPQGNSLQKTLNPGDAHLVKMGQGHYGRAGEEGVRFICVATKR